jgi:serine/threonine protein kinase
MESIASANPFEDVLARYGFQLQTALGRGGQAMVFRAHDARQNRTVALKLVVGTKEDPLRRLKQEFSFLHTRSHPSLLTVYEFREAERDGIKHMWFTMELCSGSLASELSEAEILAALERGDPLLPRIVQERRKLRRPAINRMHTMDLRSRILCMLECMDALSYVHHQGISHRDIKPANLIVDTKGKVKLGDFGTAKMAWASHRYSQSERRYLIGTPQYIAPELWRALREEDLGEQDLIRADQYAMGITVIETLQRGRRPARLDQLPVSPQNLAELELFNKVHSQGVFEPLQIPEWQGTPDNTNDVLSQLLAVDPYTRYESMGRCALDLVSALTRDGLLRS